MIRDQIKKDLAKALKKLRLPTAKLTLEHPAQMEHGDYSTNIAMVLFSQKKGGAANPYSLAQQITNAFRSAGLPDYVAKVKVEKPGFINLWLKNEMLIKEMERVLIPLREAASSAAPGAEEAGGGVKRRSRSGKSKTIMVEFAHPNTHKQFHIGHLRNICLGESLSRLLEANHQEVIRANYQGDVGLHVAKCLWALQRSRRQTPRSLADQVKWLAAAYARGHQAYQTKKKAKEEIDALNQKIYAQSKEVLPLWQRTRGWSLKYFDKIYQRLGIKFDRLYFESEVAEPGKQLVLAHPKVFVESEGAIVFPGEKYGLHTRVFINQKGLPTYEAKDLALAKLQFKECHPYRIIHVVGPEQKAYFKVLFEALKQIMPSTANKEFHLVYGWVRLKEGKMASRTGQVVLAEWLLDEVKKRLQKAYQKMPATVAEKVAVGAVKYSLLKFNATSEIVFDIDESINLAGDSGPYLQYAYARCRSVVRRAKFPAYTTPQGCMLGDEEINILRQLYRFPEVVAEAGEKKAPNLVCNFLFELAQAYNLFYNQQPILKAEPEELKQFRLALTAAVAQVIQKGLDLLGIEAVERL